MKEKWKNKKVVYTLIGIISVVLVAIVLTYAYWVVTRSQTERNLITSGCLDISISDESNDIELLEQYPISDEEGALLTPYEFTVTNNCNTSVVYQIALEMLGDSETSVISSAIKTMLDEEKPLKLSEVKALTPTLKDAFTSNELGVHMLDAKASVSHKLRLWISEDAPISEANKTFRSKVTVTTGQGIEMPIIQKGSLAYNILNQAKAENYLYNTSPGFTEAVSKGEYGIYTAQDDLGESYYFRGTPTNNYVQFGTYAEDTTLSVYNYRDWDNKSVEIAAGSPIYWRIVRINGDGTIRLIYDGTEKVINGTDHIATIEATSFNPSSGAKYVGYTYDKSDIDITQVDSNIKEVIDDWYNTHLKKKYGSYIADSIFCNDRTNSVDEYGSIVFSPTKRTTKPILTCPKKDDRYTVSDTENGNGLLSNPVGIISADEAIFAGGIKDLLGNTYLFSGEQTWTSSPISYPGDFAASFYLDNVGTENFRYDSGIANDWIGARPVINLKADVKFEGTGTIDDPYTIVME